MPFTPTANEDLRSMLSPVAQAALKSLPPAYSNMIATFRPESLSPLQIALVSAYVVKTAERFSSLSDEQKKVLALRSASTTGVQ